MNKLLSIIVLIGILAIVNLQAGPKPAPTPAPTSSEIISQSIKLVEGLRVDLAGAEKTADDLLQTNLQLQKDKDVLSTQVVTLSDFATKAEAGRVDEVRKGLEKDNIIKAKDKSIYALSILLTLTWGLIAAAAAFCIMSFIPGVVSLLPVVGGFATAIKVGVPIISGIVVGGLTWLIISNL